MHLKNDLLQLGITQYDIDSAQEFLYNINQEYFEKYITYSSPIENQIFNSDNDISTFIKPVFLQCQFFAPNFNGIVGENSSFQENEFYNCNIQNANFRFANFSDCKFYDTYINNSSLEDIEFNNNELRNCKFHGCSWSSSYLKDCLISNLNTKFCNFEGAVLSNITIINTNFLNTGFNYVEFDNVVIDNVVFPFIDFFHTFNGLTLLYKNSKKILFEFTNTNQKLSGEKCLKDLDVFLVYFYSKKDYFATANICIYMGKQEEAYYNIVNGLRNGLKKKDFKLILNLCKLASFNCFFSKKQLQDFYKLLQSDEVINNLSTYEYKYYLTEMVQIKNLLIDNPFGMPQICIEIKTVIQPDDYNSLNLLLKKIDFTAELQLPQSSKYLTLRHNSPDILEIFLSDTLPNLFIFLGSLSTILFGSTKVIKEIQGIVKTHKEIKGINLDNLIKEQELEKLKTENNKAKEDRSNMVPIINQVEKISYSIKTSISLPSDLRQNTYYNS